MTDGDADFPADKVKFIKDNYGDKIAAFDFILFSEGASSVIESGMATNYG